MEFDMGNLPFIVYLKKNDTIIFPTVGDFLPFIQDGFFRADKKVMSDTAHG